MSKPVTLFKMVVKEIRTRVIEVESTSPYEALDIVKRQYLDDKIDLLQSEVTNINIYEYGEGRSLPYPTDLQIELLEFIKKKRDNHEISKDSGN